MELRTILSLTVILTVFAASTVNVGAAKRVFLRPLSAEEVVRILKIAGREDAIPEGRVVTQGIAAVTGYALGLTKGIGGSLLFDLATSNATTQFINNFNVTAMMADFQGLNTTALASMFKLGSAYNSSDIRYKTTEICFDTRIGEPAVEQIARQAFFTSPAALNADYTDAIAATSPTAGAGTGTNTITQPAADSGQTCIVLQKPIVRKRRSSHRKRRR